MGNEKSALNGLEIDEKSVEVTDFWVHYTARVNGYNARKVSVFISEPSLHYSANFGNPSPLEKAAKNLMLHRHPFILKYVSSWSKGSKFFLTTEHVRPLIQMIETQSTLQVCMGLYSVLRALVFLHEKAHTSHNNICGSSIYVTSEGCWKLSGLECLCKSKELTSAYLKKIRSYRYERAISPDEDAMILCANFAAIDAYAFGILAEDILKLKNSEDVPNLLEFKQFCKENLQNPDARLRSNLSVVLRHPFFTHDFMKTHAFLEELPLKSSQEKEIFFGSLAMQLKAFPENVVAEQLGRLLLSRMVLLDVTAQEKLLPFLFKPKDGKDNINDNGLFAVSTFKVYLIPKLLQMFCIRDVSIRLVLLSHFSSFVHTFQADELKFQVLPELLVGIKDTNDCLVSATLRALADIVPILGAATVVGGNRGKLFTDGRPNKVKENEKANNMDSSFTNIVEFAVPVSVHEERVDLPERLSPDGGEDKKEIITSIIEEEYTWSDWDTQEPTTDDTQLCDSKSSDSICQTNGISPTANKTLFIETSSTTPNCKVIQETKITKKSNIMSDISELDIKNSKLNNSVNEEFDFFIDMEPVIQKTQVLHVQQPTSKSVFDVNSLNGPEEIDAWDEDLSDWGRDDAQELKI